MFHQRWLAQTGGHLGEAVLLLPCRRGHAKRCRQLIHCTHFTTAHSAPCTVKTHMIGRAAGHSALAKFLVQSSGFIQLRSDPAAKCICSCLCHMLQILSTLTSTQRPTVLPGRVQVSQLRL